MLGDRNIFDLELVFRGEARGAFAWLQCFVAEEKDLCSTRGCLGTSLLHLMTVTTHVLRSTACVVEHVLQAEPTIRIVLTACRLAESLRRASETPDILPVFDFWLSSLRTALDEDPFWGPAFWKDLKSRGQCMEFEECRFHKVKAGIASASIGTAPTSESLLWGFLQGLPDLVDTSQMANTSSLSARRAAGCKRLYFATGPLSLLMLRTWVVLRTPR